MENDSQMNVILIDENFFNRESETCLSNRLLRNNRANPSSSDT